MKRILTDNQVREIRRLAKSGNSVYRLSKIYGINYNSLWQLINKVTYRDVPDVEEKKNELPQISIDELLNLSKLR